ncbi:MAG: type II CAAX endopeptidase family protein [Candidatus Omnitrophota bacterium]|nr:CPBP family intramembrane metalloprotease [Candidatus Omnitrophota bacterium]
MEQNHLQTELQNAFTQGNLWASLIGLISIFLLVGAVYALVLNLRRFLRHEAKSLPLGAVPVAWNLNLIFPVGLFAFVCANLLLLGFNLALPKTHAPLSFNVQALKALLQTLIILISLTFAIIYLLWRRYVGIWQLGLNTWRREYLSGGLWAYLSILPVLALVGALLGLFRKTLLPEQEIYNLLMGLTSMPISLLFLIIVGLVAPLLEEIIFRGFLFGTLRNSFGPRRSMVYSSLLFAALHQSLVAFLPIFFLAMVLSYLYEKTGSLWPSIILHMVNNTVATLFIILIRKAI